MNVYTVRRATQGLANYLKKQKLPLSAAIAHDSRRCGRAFAEAAACVLAANGVKVYLYPRLEPTPALSWAVRYFSCGAECAEKMYSTPFLKPEELAPQPQTPVPDPVRAGQEIGGSTVNPFGHGVPLRTM